MMTLLISLLMSFNASAELTGDSKIIVNSVQRMGDHASGWDVYTSFGDTAYAMLMSFYVSDQGYENEKDALENGTFVVDATEVPFGDSADFGTITPEAARQLIKDATGYEGHEIDAEDGVILQQELEKLIKAGAKFGVQPAGGYCGISFPGLAVIDVIAKRVYLIMLAPWGEC